ncbi:hypothetical protein G6011_00849 [Alternaria panax]|uniref:Uncharacterized protein n=1 Tax=Alternaria panax TaxID=48097 RepID=A0AAD4NVC2_9PLEO|nr:hypothetical protein G6011_00849 [Alternaria panax]
MAHPDQAWKDRAAIMEPATASWGVRIHASDFAKLKAGIESESMDDKWNIWSEEMSENNNICVHYARSWTGNKMYILHVKPNAGDGDAGAKIEGITWAQGKGRVDEEQGKRNAIIITRGILDCEIDALPPYRLEDFGENPASKRVFEEQKRQELADEATGNGTPR